MMLKRSVVFLLVLMIVGLFAVTAYAAQSTTAGSLNRNGALTQFWYLRYHTSGVISENLYDNTVNLTRLGLRNTSGNQFSITLEWSDALGRYGSKSFGTFEAGKPFYMNGRMGSCLFYQDNYFAGTLTY